MTELYLVRHGESLGNSLCRFTGQDDSPLTALGIEQAELTREYLSAIKFDVCYASSLKRAYDTGRIIIDGKADIIIDENLREIDGGEWERKTYDQLAAEYPVEREIWLNDIGHAHPVGGEAVSHVYGRVNKEIERIALACEGKRVLVATHATPIRCIQCRVEGYGAESLKDIKWVPNSSVSILLYDDGKFRFTSLGYCKHLGNKVTGLPKTI